MSWTSTCPPWPLRHRHRLFVRDRGGGGRRPPAFGQAGRGGRTRCRRMAARSVRRRLARVDLRGGHALHAPGLRDPGPGHPAGRRRSGPGHRPAGLRVAQAGRTRDRRLLLPVLSARTITYKGMLTSHQLAEFFPDLSDERVTAAWPWSTPVSPPTPSRVAPGPPLPVPGPQRRDQHPGRATATGCGLERRSCPADLIPGDSSGPSHRHPRGQRLGLLRRGAGAPPSGRPAPAPRRADDDPRGVGEPPDHGPGPEGLLPFPRRPDGAVGRSGVRGLH